MLTAPERERTVLFCISNTVLKKCCCNTKSSCDLENGLDPSFPFSSIIAVSVVTKNSSRDVINFTEESDVFRELFIVHKTFIKCYQTTCKSSIMKSISIEISINLSNSYILWNYSSAVPYMWLQNAFSAILDPVASLGRLLVFEQCCWAVLSQLLTTAKGPLLSWALQVMVCAGLPLSPSPTPVRFSCC